MDPLKPLSDFFDGIARDPRIGSSHIALYTALHQIWVRGNCKSPIRIFSYTVMPVAKISGSETYHKILKDLNEYGYLRYVPHYNRKGSEIYFFLSEQLRLE
jgi:hypothetical protein